jgi:hypothetical protein
MTSHVFDRLHAVSVNDGKPVHIPTHIDANALVSSLQSLGLMVPTSVSAAAAKGEPLRASRHRFTLKEIDGALSKANVDISDRFRLKTAMSQNGIL